MICSGMINHKTYIFFCNKYSGTSKKKHSWYLVTGYYYIHIFSEFDAIGFASREFQSLRIADLEGRRWALAFMNVTSMS